MKLNDLLILAAVFYVGYTFGQVKTQTVPESDKLDPGNQPEELPAAGIGRRSLIKTVTS